MKEWIISEYLLLAIVIWTVVLIDEDRSGHVLHRDVLEAHVGGDAARGVWPRLDADPVHCVGEGAVPHGHTNHGLLVMVLAEAPNADPMARPARHALNAHLLAPITERDAVVTGPDVGASDVDPRGAAHMDPVSVEAVLRCVDRDVLERHVLAVQELHMEQLAVEGGDVLDVRVGDRGELQILAKIEGNVTFNSNRVIPTMDVIERERITVGRALHLPV